MTNHEYIMNDKNLLIDIIVQSDLMNYIDGWWCETHCPHRYDCNDAMVCADDRSSKEIITVWLDSKCTE